MTPIYSLTIGDTTFFEGYQHFEDEIVAIFSESERMVTKSEYGDEDTELEEFSYRTKAQNLIERLDLMGFTEKYCETEFAEGIESYVESLKLDLESQEHILRLFPENSKEHPGLTERIAFLRTATDALLKTTLCEWVNAFTSVTGHGYWLDDELKELSLLERCLAEGQQREGLYIPFSDLRGFVRACLRCVDPDEEVVLDYTTAVYEDKCSPYALLSLNANARLSQSARPGEKIILLTEGQSDALILSRSLKKLFPHLAELFSFLDHSTFAFGGGTANIVSLLKGLASCAIANRVVAIFDNDATGTAFKRKAEALALPNNFKLLQLPELHLAKAYPAGGPTGPAVVDINGSACSIELYLGQAALLQKDGTLMPVQWTGIDRSLNRYQGELLDKKVVQETFFDCLDHLPPDSTEFDDIRSIFQTIFHALKA